MASSARFSCASRLVKIAFSADRAYSAGFLHSGKPPARPYGRFLKAKTATPYHTRDCGKYARLDSNQRSSESEWSRKPSIINGFKAFNNHLNRQQIVIKTS